MAIQQAKILKCNNVSTPEFDQPVNIGTYVVHFCFVFMQKESMVYEKFHDCPMAQLCLAHKCSKALKLIWAKYRAFMGRINSGVKTLSEIASARIRIHRYKKKQNQQQHYSFVEVIKIQNSFLCQKLYDEMNVTGHKNDDRFTTATNSSKTCPQ